MRKTSLAVALGAMALLSACGSTTEDRTLGGAALGAGMGAGLGLAVGGIGVLPGLAVGAITGSTMGAFTDPERIDYGVPVWRQPIITERFDDVEVETPEPRPENPDDPQPLAQ